jgi:5-methylcytosine-specific restriction protein B
MAALNQIFFGPPGTGKTYATVEATLQILDPNCLTANAENRTALKARFDEFAACGDVRFVTFHQSFSYEDFVEGLRADSGEDGQLRYSIVPGIFKTMCEPVRSAFRAFEIGHTFGTGYKVIRANQDVVEVMKPKGNHLEIGMGMLTGLANAVLAKKLTISDLRDQSWDEKLQNSTFDPFLVNGYKNFLPAMVEHMVGGQAGGLFDIDEVALKKPKPKVLIIDEINRGNVSRIFGELITLIEPSKRVGAQEALEVTLPYSKDRFSVPANLHIIGTMNTADRSLAAMDIALRRRFTFIEVPPNPELLEDVEVDGIAVDELLSVMNARIAALLDRDHCLGHAYFMPLRSEPTLAKLAGIFQQQILPLLQEYFFEDWQRIQWVLNDQRKAPEYCFLIQPSQDISQLFGDSVVVGQSNERWEVNQAAFTRVQSYLGIIDHNAKPAAEYVPQTVQHNGLTVKQLASGTIEVLRDGHSVKPVKPVLRELAKQYGLPIVNGSGIEMNTRRLGARVIRAIGEPNS